MPELASFPYSEQATVYTESGEQLGFAYFRGCASLRHECGTWSWGGRLSEPDFDLAAAEKENSDRRHQRPDIALGAVTVRVVDVRRRGRPLDADQQQDLVEEVGEGVDALAQHRAGTGDQEPHELRDHHDRVTADRSYDRELRPSCRHVN